MVGDDREGSRKDGSNSAVPRRDVKGGVTVSVTLWKRELIGDRGYAQDLDRVPPLVSAADQGGDGGTWGRKRVGVSIGRGGGGIYRAPPHQSVHKEATDDHRGDGGLPACLCIVHGGVEDAGDEPDGTMVVSRRGKLSGGINE